MPVYEFRCPACEEHFEKLVSISARDLQAECPSCGGRSDQRLLSTFAAFSADGGEAAPVGGGCCGGGAGGCACRA